MSRSLAQAFLQGEVSELFPLQPNLPADRRAAVEAAIRPLAPEVAKELEAQNAALGPSPARQAHLASLRSGAAAVITGQQVGLFLGPLYTIYKAATAIRFARLLQEECGVPVVPIFWLQTEDHDLPEIASTSIVTSSAELRPLSLPSDDGRISIAHRALPEEVEGLLQILRDELGDRPEGLAHVERLARHYRSGAGWAQAFAGVLAELFADDGLVLIDPRTPTLARAAIPIHRKALADADGIARTLQERGSRLQALGFSEAVYVREGAPLSFFHPEGARGPRYRLDAELVEVGGAGSHDRGELLRLLEEEPSLFSTSALLRPFLQDHLLPTAAYVGGPGELAYFAQLSSVYAAFDRRMPLIVHRARFDLVEPRARRLLERHQLRVSDTDTEERLLSRLAPRDLIEPDALAAALLGPLEETLTTAAAPMAGELERSLSRTRRSLHVAVERFARRYGAVRLRRDQALVDDVRRLLLLLKPQGAPQERILCFASFAARYGDEALVRKIVDAVDPLDPSLRELVL